MPLKTIIALLSLSTKYDFKHIRKNVVLQISRQYPMDLDRYCALDDNSELFGRTREGCHFRLLEAVFTANVDVLLPALYYACADFPLSEIAFNPGLLPDPCLKRLIDGKEKLHDVINEIVAGFPGDLLKESGASVCENKGCINDGPFVVSGLNEFIGTASLKIIEGEQVVETCFRACKKCKAKMIKIINHHRELIWSVVPTIFGLENWEVLQTKLNEIFTEGS